MRGDFEALGFRTVGFRPRVYLINSCTVTHRTDRDTRHLGARRDAANDCMVIVTGCYMDAARRAGARRRRSSLMSGGRARTGRRVWLAPGRPCVHAGRATLSASSPFPDNTQLVRSRPAATPTAPTAPSRKPAGPPQRPPIAPAGGSSPAQGGGRAGRHPPRHVRWAAEEDRLDGLVRRLCRLDCLRRLRLSSIEPREISDELVAIVCAGGRALAAPETAPCRRKLCRHLHIPLRSGCDATLAWAVRMTAFRDLIERIRDRGPLVGSAPT